MSKTEPPLEAIFNVTRFLHDEVTGLRHYAEAALDTTQLNDLDNQVFAVLSWLAKVPAYAKEAAAYLARIDVAQANK
jgi:hypothetical protein